MKKIFGVMVLFLTVLAFCPAEGISEEARKGNEKADMSYAFGMVVASDLVGTGLDFNYDSFILGLREVMENQKTRYTMDEANDMIQTAYTTAQAKLSERNWAEGTAFLEKNGKRDEVITTPSGLQYESIVEGTGDTPGAADSVLVNYQGATIDGKVFDSTYDAGKPMEVPLDRVIPGWSEGLRMMKVGGKAKLYIPPSLAYGDQGTGGLIGPNSVLVFDVELVSIVKPSSDGSSDTVIIPPEDLNLQEEGTPGN
ncbi:MAG: FKBP-type peptidyl-prolyl cis-trans isomerase [Treponema sp.]|nr:FKBP-type peptidyl-prolyl cis-trans isomerase [Treponema sp.]